MMRVLRKILRGKTDAVRGGWIFVFAVLGMLCVQLPIAQGLSMAFSALFNVWGITQTNAALAPAWARFIYRWHGSAITVLSALATLGLARLFRRWFGGAGRPQSSAISGVRFALIGIGAALLSEILFCLIDSMRPLWSPLEPRLTAALPALLLISLLSVMGEEAFTKRFLLDALAARWGSAWAALAVTLWFFLTNGGLSGGVIGVVDVALLGALLCAVYAEYGLAATVGLRWGWNVTNLFLLGFGGGDYAIYKLYGVSEMWLTGGDTGPMAGIAAALLFAAGLMWLRRAALRHLAAGLQRKDKKHKNAHTP